MYIYIQFIMCTFQTGQYLFVEDMFTIKFTLCIIQKQEQQMLECHQTSIGNIVIV